MSSEKKLNDQLLQSLVAEIVKVAQPERIILFGSRARGNNTPDSDVDLLVVKKGEIHRRRTAQKIYSSIGGVGVGVDVVVVTEDDIVRFRDKVGTIIAPALAEGKVVYDAHV